MYTAVFTACVHGHAQAVYMVRPCPEHGRARLCTLYTGVFTARVHSRVRTVNTAVFRACLHGRVPCSRAFTESVHGLPFAAVFPVYKPCTMAVYRIHGCSRPYARSVHGRVQGPYTAVYTVRSGPCTQAVKKTVCTVHCRARGRVRVMYGRVPGPYTP